MEWVLVVTALVSVVGMMVLSAVEERATGAWKEWSAEVLYQLAILWVASMLLLVLFCPGISSAPDPRF